MTAKESDAFFVSGGTLSLHASSYLARDADRAVLAALEAGRYCYILNSRQLGKSSLCIRTRAKLEMAGIRTAFIDLTRIGGFNVNPEQWYAGLSGELGRALKLRSEFLQYLKLHESISPMQRFFGAIREVALERLDSPLVIFIDEIDAIQSLPFDMDEFFAGIRECFNRRVVEDVYERLTFCLIGVAIPNDLIKNPKTTPFNIGEGIYLRDFTLEELAPFSAALGKRGPVLLNQVYYWTNGHPFLTQSLCAVIERNASIRTAKDVDALVRNEFFQPSSCESNVNLADVSNRVVNVGTSEGDPDKFQADLLSAYERAWRGEELPDDESSSVIAVLKLSGLMRTEGRRLVVRNRIYKKVFDGTWITEHMPGSELLRQKKAYRRGLIRAAMVSALMLLGVGSLASYALVQAKRANALATSLQDSSSSLQVALGKQKSATLRATDSASAARLAESRSRALVAERDSALTRAKASAGQERAARALADQRSKDAIIAKHRADKNASLARFAENAAKAMNHEAQLQAYELYVANLKITDASIANRQYALARTVIDAMRAQPGKGWEYGMLCRELQAKDRSLAGHGDALNDVGFTPDGRQVITSDFSGKVMVWDAATSARLRSYDYGMLTWSFAVSPNGRIAVTSARNGGVLAALDPATGKKLWQVDTGAAKINKVVFSQDGRTIAGAGPQGAVVFLDPSSGTVLKRFAIGSSELSSIAINPRTSRFVVGCLDHNAYICSGDSGKILHTLSGHSEWVWGVSYSRLGDQILTCSVDRTARLWDGQSGEMMAVLSGHDDSVINGENSPDGKQWITADDDDTARLWDAKGHLLDTFTSHTAGVTSARFSPRGDSVVTASRDWTARLWDLDPTPGTRLLYQFDSRVNAVDVSRTHPWVLAGSRGKAVLVDANTGRLIQSFPISPDGEAFGVALSTDSKLAAVTDSGKGAGSVFDLTSGKLVASLPKGFLTLRFAPNGRLLASDNPADRSIEIFDVGSWKGIKTLRGPKANVVDIQFSPDGKLLIASSYDRNVYVWDLASGTVAHVLGPFNGPVWPVAISPDGSLIGAGDNLGEIKIWDFRTMKLKCEAKALTGACEGLSFTPDSKTVLATGIRGDLSVMDASNGRVLVNFHSKTGQNRRMAVFPNGRAVVAGGDGSVRIWEPLSDSPRSTPLSPPKESTR